MMSPATRQTVGVAATVMVAVCAMVGCASSPKAAPERDLVARTSTVLPGLAGLYLYQASGHSMFRSLNDVEVYGKFLDTIENGRYVMTHLKGGSDVLTVKVRRAAHTSVDTQGSTTVAVEAGRVYYVRIRPSGTGDHRPQSMPLLPAEGAKALQNRALASGSHYH